LVECEGIESEEMNDKLVCRRRKIVAFTPCDEILRAWARWCALQVIHLWKAPSVVREYLETGDPDLRAAAWDTSWDTASAASLAAARSAASSAARFAAWDAASAASWFAARASARDAARAVGASARVASALAREAAKARQNKQLVEMLTAAMKEMK
jgi:hypothetical protein